MRILNFGILAHVDAGKTALTERLHAAGVVDEIDSVDDGSTRAESLALEWQRGITIKSAVVSFVVDDVAVNPIHTPGPPDFIVEVEWVLCVLERDSDVDRYQPVESPPPARPRTERSLLNRQEHLLRAAWRSVTKGDAHAVR